MANIGHVINGALLDANSFLLKISEKQRGKPSRMDLPLFKIGGFPICRYSPRCMSKLCINKYGWPKCKMHVHQRSH